MARRKETALLRPPSARERHLAILARYYGGAQREALRRWDDEHGAAFRLAHGLANRRDHEALERGEVEPDPLAPRPPGVLSPAIRRG